jgi:hypothetical protein
MKKIMSASFLAAFALIMLLPVTRQVNAASVNRSVLRQGGVPLPGSSGGGHYQGGVPLPGSSGGGHYQGGVPLPGSSGGGH